MSVTDDRAVSFILILSNRKKKKKDQDNSLLPSNDQDSSAYMKDKQTEDQTTGTPEEHEKQTTNSNDQSSNTIQNNKPQTEHKERAEKERSEHERETSKMMIDDDHNKDEDSFAFEKTMLFSIGLQMVGFRVLIWRFLVSRSFKASISD